MVCFVLCMRLYHGQLQGRIIIVCLRPIFLFYFCFPFAAVSVWYKHWLFTKFVFVDHFAWTGFWELFLDKTDFQNWTFLWQRKLKTENWIFSWYDCSPKAGILIESISSMRGRKCSQSGSCWKEILKSSYQGNSSLSQLPE